MFSLSRPTPAFIDARIAAARESPSPTPRTLFASGQPLVEAPYGYVHDFSESQLGVGQKAFAAARAAILNWTPFDIGWVRVANPSAPVRLDEIIAVEIHALGLWSLNSSRIVDVIDLPWEFGFVYSTTGLHIEEGEEKFSIILDPEDDIVWYQIEAFSHPRHPLVWLGNPMARHLQHRFVRDSHQRMKGAVSP